GRAAAPGAPPLPRYVRSRCRRSPGLAHSLADVARAEAVVRAPGLDRTLARPPRLTDGAGRGRYRSAVDRNVLGGVTISRADLAVALLEQAADPSSIGHVVSVAG